MNTTKKRQEIDRIFNRRRLISTSLKSKKSKPGFARRHKKKLIAALGIGGAIAVVYMSGVSKADLATLFNKSRSYVDSAVASGKSKVANWSRGLKAWFNAKPTKYGPHQHPYPGPKALMKFRPLTKFRPKLKQPMSPNDRFQAWINKPQRYKPPPKKKYKRYTINESLKHFIAANPWVKQDLRDIHGSLFRVVV